MLKHILMRCVFLSLLFNLIVGTATAKESIMHPDYPIMTGTKQISEDWQLTLNSEFNRRVEDGSLVLWKPKFTMWINIWGNDHNTTIEQRIKEWQSDISKQAFDIKNNKDRFSYRLSEDEGDKRVPAFYGFIFGKSGHVQLAIYFDDENSVAEAEQIFLSFKELINK